MRQQTRIMNHGMNNRLILDVLHILMPLERISRGFKDLSLSFKANPLSKDLNTIQNEVAISRAIRNLVLTYRQERFFNPQLGTGVSKLLFENMTPVVSELIRDEITRVINNYEPRVELSNVIVAGSVASRNAIFAG